MHIFIFSKMISVITIWLLFTSQIIKNMQTYYILYQSFQASIIRYHRLNVLDNRHLFSHSSRAEKSQLKVQENQDPGQSSLPGLQRTSFSLSPHMAFPLATHRESNRSLMSLPFPLRPSIQSDQGTILKLSVNYNFLFKVSISFLSNTARLEF